MLNLEIRAESVGRTMNNEQHIKNNYELPLTFKELYIF